MRKVKVINSKHPALKIGNVYPVQESEHANSNNYILAEIQEGYSIQLFEGQYEINE